MSASTRMRALAAAALVATAVTAGGCETDACRGVDGTCIALTVTGQGSVDGVKLTLSGAASGMRVAPPTAELQPLPLEIGLQLSSASSGTLHIDALGLLLGGFAGEGSADVDISPGAHRVATIDLSGGGGGGGGGDGDGGVVSVPFDVTGTRVRHYLLGDGGVTDVPTDFTSVRISAYVDNPDGGVITVAGSGDANGNFTIKKVPRAPYVLHYGSTYVSGSAKHPDLGAWILGRADQTAATTTTTLSINLSNLSPYAMGDTFQLFSMNAGTAIFGLENLFPPGNGSTTMSGSLDLSKMFYGNLIDGAKGDDMFVAQLVSDSGNGVSFVRLAKIGNFPTFTINNGGSASPVAAMTDVTQSGALAINWTRSQFAQYRKAINPYGSVDADAFYLWAQPGGLAHGTFSSTPDVLVVHPPNGSTDVALATSYGNPYPASWPLVAAAAINTSVSYTAAGATTAGTFGGAVFTSAPLASLPSPTLPVISPVKSPTIDGNDLFSTQVGVSTTPLIAWSAPALGTASSYGVYLYALDNVGGNTSFDQVATFYTTGTSVAVPPGLLAGGQHYFVDITAFADGVDRTTTPFTNALPSSYADALSAPVVVGLVAEAASCKALLALHPGLPDGVYTIDVDGSGAAPPVNVWCDMTTAGGGWTLCAWSQSPSAQSITWASPAQAKSSNWYACQHYSATPVGALLRVANSSNSYASQYASVDFRPSAGKTMSMPSVAHVPNLSLTLFPQTAGCDAASPNNFQWELSTDDSIFGLTPSNSCNGNGGSIFIAASGANTNGCAGNNQISPQVGYPCGGFGDHGVHLELWAR